MARNVHATRRATTLEGDQPARETFEDTGSLARQLKKERDLTIRLLRLANSPDDLHGLMLEATKLLQEWSECTAVGIRLRDGEDFPYFETRGFPAEFVEAENTLCVHDVNGQLARDFQGNPVLECMCGNILCGRFDPSLPFFTVGGSFWSNSTSQLLASTTEADRQVRTRNRCNGEGYESTALIPLRADENTFGLLQLNDHRPGRFTVELIANLEALAAALAEAIARPLAVKELRLSRDQLQMQAQELRKSEDHFRLLYEQAPLGYQSLDVEGRVLAVNQAWLDMLGYSREEALARSFAEFLTPDGRDSFSPRFRRFKEIGEVHDIEFDMVRKDRSVVTVSIGGRIGRNSRGKFARTHSVLHDITTRKQNEALLIVGCDLASSLNAACDLDQVLRLSLTAALDTTEFDCGSICLVDNEREESRSRCSVGLNAEFCAAVDSYTLDSEQGRCVQAGRFIQIDGAAAFSDARQEGIESIVVVPVMHEGGTIASLNLCSREDGQITTSVRRALQAIASLTGIAISRELSKESLCRSRAELQAIYDNSPIMMCLLDAEFRLLYVNRTMAEFTGQPEDELLGQRAGDFMRCINALDGPNGCGSGDDCESCAFRQALTDTLQTGRSNHKIVSRITTARNDGPCELVLLASTTLIPTHAGAQLLISLEDATDARQTEQALQENETRFRRAFEDSAVGMAILDTNGRYIQVNQALCDILGYSEHELLSLETSDITYPGDPDWNSEIVLRLRRGDMNSLNLEKRYVHKDGHTIWANVVASCVRDRGGKVIWSLGQLQDITERRQVEEKLRRSEGRFRAMFHGHDAIMLLIDNETGEIRDANHAAGQFYGYQTEQLRQMTIQQINALPAEEVARQRALAFEGEQNCLIFPHRLSSGEVRTVEVQSTAISTGDEVVLLSIIHDITDRKRTEEALKEKERFLREMASNIPGAVYQLIRHPDRSLEIPYMSEGGVALLGRPLEDLQDPATLFGNVHPDDLEDLWTSLEVSATALSPWRHEFRIIVEGERQKWLRGVSRPSELLDGGICWNGVLLDISDARLAEQSLRQSELQFRRMFDNAIVAVALHEIVVNDQGVPIDYTFLRANAAFEQQTGLRLSKILGRRVTEVLPANEVASLIRTYGSVALNGKPASFETFSATLDRHFSVSAYQVGPGRFATLFLDISEQRRVADALRKSEEKYRRFVVTACEGIWSMDSEHRTTFANPRMAAMLGYEAEEMLGQRVEKFVFESDLDSHAQHMKVRHEGRSEQYEHRFRRKDGSEVWATVSATSLTDDQGRFAGSFAMFTDITGRRATEDRLDALQKQLNHTSRLAVMGEMAAGIAHEINQPLCAIVNFAKACQNLASREPANLGQICKWTEAIINSASRTGDIVRRLLRFARPHEPDRETVLPRQLIEDAVLLIRHEARSHQITLHVDVLENDLTVNVQAVRIQQVLVNVLRNSIEAFPTESPVEKRIAVSADRLPSGVRISIADNGGGVPESDLQRLFEPFFSTKAQGLGLGLAISRTIIEDHGGRIEANVNPNGGLTFHFTLPTDKVSSQDACG